MLVMFQARCDFEEIVQKYCPDFDLKAELHKSLHDKDAPKARRKIRAHRKSDTINTSRSHRGGKFGTLLLSFIVMYKMSGSNCFVAVLYY